MTTVEFKRDFRNKSGYTRILLTETPFGKVKYRCSLCYPSYRKSEYVEYTQNTYEMSKNEANALFLRLKKQGFTSTVTKC